METRNDASDQKESYLQKARKAYRALYAVDPERHKNPEDNFKKIDIEDQPTRDEINQVLNRLLKQGHRVMGVSPN